MIEFFRNHPDSKNYNGERATPLGSRYSWPVPCAPPSLVSSRPQHPFRRTAGNDHIYGSANGFGWNENDIIAAQIVSVPASLPVQMADLAFRRLLVSLGIVGLLTLIVVDLAWDVAVIRPVSRFAVRADEISKGQLDVPELVVRGRDEISLLAAAFNRMHRSVSAAMHMLEQESGAAPEEQAPNSEPDQE